MGLETIPVGKVKSPYPAGTGETKAHLLSSAVCPSAPVRPGAVGRTRTRLPPRRQKSAGGQTLRLHTMASRGNVGEHGKAGVMIL